MYFKGAMNWFKFIYAWSLEAAPLINKVKVEVIHISCDEEVEVHEDESSRRSLFCENCYKVN